MFTIQNACVVMVSGEYNDEAIGFICNYLRSNMQFHCVNTFFIDMNYFYYQ
jgi:hypothetical protein